MDLRRKLALLEDRRPESPRPPPAALAPADERSHVLGELRQKIAEVLGRSAPPRRLAEPTVSRLPFQRIESEDGILYRRLEELAPSHHVGRIPVDAAGAASSELVALLALDPGLSRVRFRGALFLDTETTGLGGAGVLPFLVGLAWFDERGRVFLEQLLLRRPCDERALITHVRAAVERAEVLVTYNGKSFDLPLLAGRCVMNHLPALPPRPHLDLLHVARRLHKRRLGQCRLISLESGVLGFERGPDVEGADVAARYAHFLRSGDEASLEAVVLHNAWDVLSMAALVGLYGEPVDLLPAEDLVGLARTLRRAGDLDQAARVVDVAVERDPGPGARRARGEIAKARGDRARALADFESLLEEVDDALLRLELVKLYEHHAREPVRALDLLQRGTGEAPDAVERRRSRLERKVLKGSSKTKVKGALR
jgi:uncharacterized protein